MEGRDQKMSSIRASEGFYSMLTVGGRRKVDRRLAGKVIPDASSSPSPSIHDQPSNMSSATVEELPESKLGTKQQSVQLKGATERVSYVELELTLSLLLPFCSFASF